MRMDRYTKALLWVTALTVLSYAVWVYVDCAMDSRCHLKICGRTACGFVRDAR
jgi:hypothetical protein